MESRSYVSLLAALASLAAVAPVAALGAGMPDVERGRALYENHCIGCHGRSVHARPGKTPPTHDELRQIVVRWTRAEGLDWTDEEVADVSAYLERVVYRKAR